MFSIGKFFYFVPSKPYTLILFYLGNLNYVQECNDVYCKRVWDDFNEKCEFIKIFERSCVILLKINLKLFNVGVIA